MEGITVARLFPSREYADACTARAGRKRLSHEENVHLLVFLVVGDWVDEPSESIIETLVNDVTRINKVHRMASKINFNFPP